MCFLKIKLVYFPNWTINIPELGKSYLHMVDNQRLLLPWLWVSVLRESKLIWSWARVMNSLWKSNLLIHFSEKETYSQRKNIDSHSVIYWYSHTFFSVSSNIKNEERGGNQNKYYAFFLCMKLFYKRKLIQWNIWFFPRFICFSSVVINSGLYIIQRNNHMDIVLVP